MTEADVLRGQELIEAIQATKEIIAKLKTGIKAEISDVTVRGFEKNSKGESASMRHSTEKYEFQLNVSRSAEEVTGLTHNYLASLLGHYELELEDLENDLTNLGKEKSPLEIIKASDEVLNEMADAALGAKEN